MTAPIELMNLTEVANALNLYLQEVRPSLFRMENVCEYVAKNMRYIDFVHDSPDTIVVDPNFIHGLVEELLKSNVVALSRRASLSGDGLLLKGVRPSEVTRQDPSSVEDYVVSRKNVLLYSTTDWLQWYLNGDCRQLIDALERSNEISRYQRQPERKTDIPQAVAIKESAPSPASKVDLIYQVDYAYDCRIPDLEEVGYIKSNSYSILDGKTHNFYFKPSQNENPEHNCLKLQLYQYLKEKGAKDLATQATDRADVEFTDKDGRRVGVEVMTDTYNRQPEQMAAKVADYNKTYPHWFIVATHQKVCRELKKMPNNVQVMERKDVVAYLNNLL